MIDHTNIHKRTIREKILHFIKIFAPLLAVVLLLFLFLWPMVHKSSTTNIHTSVDTGYYSNLKTSVTNSTVVGTSTSGDTYKLHTDKIYKYTDPQYKNDDTYHLEHADLLQNFANGGTFKIRGSFGILNRTRSLMFLSKGVYVLRNGEDKAYAESMDIDVKNRLINNQVPFVDWGPSGFFVASQGLSYDLTNKTITLKGKSRVVLFNKPNTTDEPTDEQKDEKKEQK